VGQKVQEGARPKVPELDAHGAFVDGINGHAGKQEQMIHFMTLRSQSQHARHGPTTILWPKLCPEPTTGWKVGKPVEKIDRLQDIQHFSRKKAGAEKGPLIPRGAF
jgi:hypothetical protein